MLPKSLRTLSADAFWCCESLKRFHLPANTEIEPTSALSYGLWEDACNLFFRCDSMEEVTVDEGNPLYEAENNCIIRKSDRTLIAGCPASIIPEGVRAIGTGAFQAVAGLGDFEIPYGVEEIGDYAFAECFGLTMLRIPDSVTYMGDYATAFCLDLDSTAIPESTLIPHMVSSGSTGVYYMVPEGPPEMSAGWRSNDFNTVWASDLAYEDHYPYVTSITVLLLSHNVKDESGITAKTYIQSSCAAPLRKGYRFEGWATEPNGPVVYPSVEYEFEYRTEGDEHDGEINHNEPYIRGLQFFTYVEHRHTPLPYEELKLLPAYTKLYAIYTKL